jgi:hypothetical protein
LLLKVHLFDDRLNHTQIHKGRKIVRAQSDSALARPRGQWGAPNRILVTYTFLLVIFIFIIKILWPCTTWTFTLASAVCLLYSTMTNSWVDTMDIGEKAAEPRRIAWKIPQDILGVHIFIYSHVRQWRFSSNHCRSTVLVCTFTRNLVVPGIGSPKLALTGISVVLLKNSTL